MSTRQQLDKVTVQALRLPNATVPFSTIVNDLGVQLDSQLIMADHTAALSLILLLPPTTAQIDQAVIDASRDKDTCACFC